MDTLREFVDKGFRDESSDFRKVARRFWMAVASKAATGHYATWVQATLYKCTGLLNMQEALAHWTKDEFFNEMLQELVETILNQEHRLENGVAWQRVVAAPEDKQTTPIDEFMGECIELFKNSCIDKLRNTEGTFPYYYRLAQNRLRKYLSEISWSLYDPKSRYYGPAGPEKPVVLDIMDEGLLNSIPVPQEMSSTAERVFFRKPLLAHAQWFHESIDKTREAAVAIRNLVKWLCMRYALLSGVVHGMTEEDMGMAYAAHEPPCDTEELVRLAKKAAAQLDDREKQILLMLMQQIPYEEIASALNLSGASHVNYYKRKIRKIMRDIRYESPAMSGAVDEESAFEYGNSREAQQIFTENLMKFCRE